MCNQQRIVRFFGRVQGVGFRYTACRVAGGYDVVGYVRNLSDGSVECIAEGEISEIDSFLGELSDSMSGHIRSQKSQKAPFSGRFKTFTVAF